MGVETGSVFLHQEWDYPAPVYVGDTVTAEAGDRGPGRQADHPPALRRQEQDGVEVLRGECLVTTMLPDGPVAAGG